MTIVVTIRVNDGIVLAADSATSFIDADGTVVKVYNSANKIFNLIKGRPIGAMTFGSGAIGTASIATLSKDFRDNLGDSTSPHYIDPAHYSMEEVAQKARAFLFEECFRTEYPEGRPNFHMGYRLCGYSSTGSLPECWEIVITENDCTEPVRIYDDDSYGPRWAGETEAIDRLVLGVGSRHSSALVDLGAETDQAVQLTSSVIDRLYAKLYLPAMPIQDAIDLAQFLAETAARFTHFSLRAATVGGPIELATITKHEGFKWVARKHYFNVDLNRP